MKTILILLYSALTLWALLSVVFHGTRPSRSLSWVFTILFFPFLGPFLYYLFGVNRRKFKFYKLKGTLKRKLYDEERRDIQLPPPREVLGTSKNARLAKILQTSTQFPPKAGNKVAVLHAGRETFECIFEAIENAREFIHLQYYIFEKGELQDRFYDLFRKKVAEGVEIRMLYDSLGSRTFKGQLKKRFRNIGVHIYPMMPLRLGSFMYTLNYRNHRKIIIIDGKIGFVGGMNVSDKYIKSEEELGVWEDLHLKLQGPAVESLHHIFIKDYYFASREEQLVQDRYLPEIEEAGDSIVQINASGPDSNHPAILYQYLGIINLAEESIRIANPYFIPGAIVLKALKVAALGGTEVKLLVPDKSDSFLAKYSMYAQFEGLLEVGVKIYLRKDFSHSKLILADQQLASVGSGNFDHRSFEHNFEANAQIYDETIAKKLCEDFDAICADARELRYDEFKNRGRLQKLKEGFARFFSPLL